jgi:tetratricopeptide (TPR) repeat protein
VEQILSPRSIVRHSAESRLDSLYHDALSHAFPDSPETRPSLENYRRVLGAILVVEVRLTIPDLQIILGSSARVDAIISDLRGLQTQITSEPTSDCPVTPASERFHASFLDFIVDPERCMDGLLRNADRFRIDLSKSHTYVAQACLGHMAHFFNSLQGQSAQSTELPHGIRCALDNWASHVHGSDVIPHDLRRAIMVFCERDFVHWFRIQIQSLRGTSALDFIPDVDPDLDAPGCLDHFRVESQRHPEYIRDVRQLGMIVSVQGVAMKLAADDHPRKDVFMVGMGDALRGRFHQVGRMSDLESALKFYREALVLCPRDHPRRLICLQMISHTLLVRYRLTGALLDVNEVISLREEAFEIASLAHSLERYKSLFQLASALYGRYERTGNPQDLKDANTMTQEACPLCETSDPDHTLLVLRKYLSRSSADIHDLNELNGVIGLLQEQVKSTPAMHPNRPDFLYNLAHALHTRFKSTGKLHDLDEAIDLRREALGSIIAIHPDRPRPLNDLSYDLGTRFKLTGQLRDLDEAIELGREVVRSIPATQPDRPVPLNNLARALRDRFRSTGQLRDLDELIELRREALGSIPATHRDRPLPVNNLIHALRTRFKSTGQLRDLDEFIDLQRKALGSIPTTHPARSEVLNNLADFLEARFSFIGQLDDSDEATALRRQLEGL